jgi:nucleotide-binding universal stress UspA family protein
VIGHGWKVTEHHVVSAPSPADELRIAGRPVVVGVDGSEPSLAAAELAAEEARRREVPLEIVHALSPPAPVAGYPPDLVPVLATTGPVEQQWHDQAEQLLGQAAAQARQSHPNLPVITRLRDGYPAELLTDASRHAQMLVVGHRGTGGFADLLLGSVAVQLANHAACPVIIVRRPPHRDAPVVVGVDGSEGSRQAAEFAAEAAAAYGVPLVALYARASERGWQLERAQGGLPPPGAPDEVMEILTGLAEQHPELEVRPEAPVDQPAHEALVDASRQARLLVVGARGLGGFRGLLLGSVSQSLIHHAECPVAVVGPASRDPALLL